MSDRSRGKYHLAILGDGPAARSAAEEAASLGARVALILDPSMKTAGESLAAMFLATLIAGSREAATLRHAASVLGADADSIRHAAFARTSRRLREMLTERSSRAATERLTSLGIDLFRGPGRFRDATSIACDGATIRFSRALISPTSRTDISSILGLAEGSYLAIETLHELSDLPARVAVLGAGPTACEAAQAFAGFGSRVTLVDRGDRILPNEDAEAAGVVAAALRHAGVYLALASEIEAIEQTDGGKRLRFQGDRHSPLFVDAILVAGKRRQNLEGLALDAAGVVADPERGLASDDLGRSKVKSICVVSETDPSAAEVAARAAMRNALLGERSRRSPVIPRSVRTSPPLMQVGLTESDANAKGLAVETYRVEWPDGKSDSDIESPGFVKAIVAPRTDRLLGLTAVGNCAIDLAGEATSEVTQRQSLRKLADIPRPIGASGDVFRRLGDVYRRAETARRARRIAWTLRLRHGGPPQT